MAESMKDMWISWGVMLPIAIAMILLWGSILIDVIRRHFHGHR